MIPTFFLHASSKAFLQSAVSTLIPLVFVHYTLSVEPIKRLENDACLRCYFIYMAKIDESNNRLISILTDIFCLKHLRYTKYIF